MYKVTLGLFDGIIGMDGIMEIYSVGCFALTVIALPVAGEMLRAVGCTYSINLDSISGRVEINGILTNCMTFLITSKGTRR